MTSPPPQQPLLHQEQTIEHLEQILQTQDRALIVLPSGAGKTHTIAFFISTFKPESFLYLVHRNEILTQTIQIFKTVCSLEDSEIGIINKRHKDFNKRYTFATIQTLSKPKNLERLKQKIEYLCIDEFHHATAQTYQNVIDIIQPQKLIGLTATPYRLDGADLLSIIDGNIANEIDLFEGIKKGILVPFDYIGLWDNIDYSKIQYQGYNYNIGDLDRQLIIQKRDEQVLDEYKKRIEGRITIGFCNSVDYVNRITSLFRKAGINAVGITHKQDSETQAQIVKDFKAGYYRVLFTRDILNEGVDFPNCSALLFLRPTISKTIFFQQLGRGLRKHPGKKDVLVLDFIGNYVRAFEKRQWLQIFKQGSTGENIKPRLDYDPKCKVWFDPRAISIMDIQERHQYNPPDPRLAAWTASIPAADKDQKIKYVKEHFIKPLQQKLQRDFITISEWRKEYSSLLSEEIRQNGYDSFRDLYGMPRFHFLNCSVCGKQFPTKYPDRNHYKHKLFKNFQTCSPKCHYTHYYKTRKRELLRKQGILVRTSEQINALSSKECLYCGKPLQNNPRLTAKRMYCSQRCGVKHHYQKNKVEMIQKHSQRRRDRKANLPVIHRCRQCHAEIHDDGKGNRKGLPAYFCNQDCKIAYYA